ncbi:MULTISPECIES: hypothetical protein [Sphingomonas]|uniref:Uncharacterized protein n=1 Tax=Sphingomonas kyungheensis TaxID=1069987 RepID=A0ABU8GZA5_9SPHN|nr:MULTISPECIES: hypothetical protein [unclassified Sphingomonas]EZP54650.1 hypothetical protein BW41_01386 [Sphingomonas sp. RIT328]
MFVDFREVPPPPRWEPEPARRRFTPRQRKTMEIVVGVNLVMLVFAPLGGATLVQAIVALWR